MHFAVVVGGITFPSYECLPHQKAFDSCPSVLIAHTLTESQTARPNPLCFYLSHIYSDTSLSLSEERGFYSLISDIKKKHKYKKCARENNVIVLSNV